MKKILLLMAFAGIFAVTNACGQTKEPAMGEPRFGIGADFAFPMGDFGDIANYGAGGSLLYQHPVTSHLNITGNVGYIRINGKEVLGNLKYKEGFVPIKGGARYFIGENFYGAGELGIAISTADGNGSGVSFIYTPAIGLEFPVSDKGSVDLGVRYENWARSNITRSFIGLRAGFNF